MLPFGPAEDANLGRFCDMNYAKPLADFLHFCGETLVLHKGAGTGLRDLPSQNTFGHGTLSYASLPSLRTRFGATVLHTATSAHEIHAALVNHKRNVRNIKCWNVYIEVRCG